MTQATPEEQSADPSLEQSSESPAADGASPWASQLFSARQAMQERLQSPEPLGRRVAEFWAEATWPLHAIEADQRSAQIGGDFLRRLARQGLTPAMNVALHHKNSHVIGSTFGPHAFEMSHDYGAVEKAIADREKAIEAGTYKDPREKSKEFKARPKALKELAYAAMGAEIELEPKASGPKERPNNFAYLAALEDRDYPAPNASPETLQDWQAACERGQALCEKFGLRSVSVPLAFGSQDAVAFVDKLDSALSELAQFLRVEPKALGLDQWLGLRARAPGARAPEEASAIETGATLADKEKAKAEKEKEEAKKKKSDSEHGLFMGNFIQIEVSPNFEPVVLAHEWFHSLDLWFGSREIVAAQPWRGWSVFASRVAFTNYEQSEGLKAWAQQLREGGEKHNPQDALAPLSFLSQMRFDLDRNPAGEFELPLAEGLASRFMRAYGEIALSDEVKEQTADQAGKLAGAVIEAAFEHAKDYAHSQQTEESLERRRREFYDEWADLACMWAQRQAGPVASADQMRDLEARLRSEILRELAGAWCHQMMSTSFPKPDLHTQHAMRMDASAGRMSPYFCTPHEMLAYKLEELFLSKAEPAPEDLVGSKLLGWLRDEAVPALVEARAVSLGTLMGVKRSKPGV